MLNRFRFVIVVGILEVTGLAACRAEAQTCVALTYDEWKAWGDLIDFKPTQSLLDTASATHWTWQSIDSGVGPLNLDRYEVEVDKMPDGFTAESLLEFVRTNLPHFLYPIQTYYGTPPPYTDFGAVDESNLGLWKNGTVGAQMIFGMRPPAMPVTLSAAGVTVPAHVLLAERSNNHWRFVTGNKQSLPHPVSGVREFGFRFENNKTIFYTRGADRISGTTYQVGSDIVFGGAEDLWDSFQYDIADFIKSRGGEAQLYDRYSARRCWEDVKGYRTQTAPNLPSTLSTPIN